MKYNRILGYGVLFLIVGVLSLQNFTNSPHLLEYHEVILLSYIPSIETTSKKQLMYPISLKKINYFEDNEYAMSDEIQPVLDSVIYIPKGFRARDLA